MHAHSHEPHTLGLGRVTDHGRPCREHFKLTIGLDHFDAALPGQFVQLQCSNATAKPDGEGPQAMSGVLLRRPFSIGGLRREGDQCEIDVVGRVVGRGTSWLDRLREGDAVSVLGPLGKPFTIPPSGTRALLIAGGVGLPPIRWLGEVLRAHGVECQAIIGAQTRDLLPLQLNEDPKHDGSPSACVEEFAREGIPTSITTDDGSCGLRGLVTTAMEAWLNRAEDVSNLRVYACGPEGMLRAIAAMCDERGTARCEVAMERTMGCGMGVCQSCVLRVHDDASESGWRYALCCAEGPVFDAKDIIWSSSED